MRVRLVGGPLCGAEFTAPGDDADPPGLLSVTRETPACSHSGFYRRGTATIGKPTRFLRRQRVTWIYEYQEELPR